MHCGGRPSRRHAGWGGSALLPAVAAGLFAAEVLLMGELGGPPTQLDTLRLLGGGWVDPVGSLLALLTLVAEALVGYLLVVLILRSLALLPGAVGRLATRVAFLVAPAAVRRALDLLVGGALLAQATLAVVPVPHSPREHSRLAPRVGAVTFAGSSTFAGSGVRPGSAVLPGSSGPARPARRAPDGESMTWLVPAAVRAEPVDARPTPRRSAAPLPPWLGGGPSKPGPTQDEGAANPPGTRRLSETRNPVATPTPGSKGAWPDPAAAGHDGRAGGVVTVEPHDTLWDIAAAHLAPAERSAANIDRHWPQVYQANRHVVGANPDLIHPGMRLRVPPYRLDHR